MNTGYFHKNYSTTDDASEPPIFLKESGGYLHKQKIPKTNLFDASNSYPLFCCEYWEKLTNDLGNVSKEIITVSIVSDPFAEFNHNKFNNFFDIFNEFKNHFIVDFSLETDYSPHHQRKVKRASKKGIEIKLCNNPLDYLNTWVKLYSKLIIKHNIKSHSLFSRKQIINHFTTPGFFAFRAEADNKVIGMALWYVSKGYAYYHLTAYSDQGYQTGASYALMDYSLNYFKTNKLKKATLGAGAGLVATQGDGLSEFKFGWSSYTRPVYFCGKINNPVEYENLLTRNNKKTSSFFPAYRHPQSS